MGHWNLWDKVFKDETEERANIEPDKLCKYGIAPLDDALCGLLPNELVVIGADTGSGKSEVALNIAQANAKAGRRVALYFLEGGHIEAMARIKWRAITEEYFNNHTELGIEMDFRRWRMNLYSDQEKQELLKIEGIVWNEWKGVFKENLQIYQLREEFTLDNLLISLMDFFEFKQGLEKVRKGFGIDLIIIDHLQYFSLPEGENEFSSITRILKQVKFITDTYNIPVIIISHLRKKLKERGMPDQEDFYGSSNIPKIASTAIMIYPDRELADYNQQIYPTYFRVVKSRTGICPSLAIRCDFHLKTRSYAKSYTIFRVNKLGQVMDEELRITELPEWANV